MAQLSFCKLLSIYNSSYDFQTM